MEQLSIRDWMVIVGGVMIAAVLVDAGRRFLKERHAEIRLNARIERSKSSSNEDDAFNLPALEEYLSVSIKCIQPDLLPES